MATGKKIPFFAELGKMLNSIRSISTELNEEIKIDQTEKAALYNMWYARENSIARLQTNLQQLETEIAYFFTGTGSWKTLDNLFNTQLLRQKFVEKFEALVHEYFNIKSDPSGKNKLEENNKPGADTKYERKALPFPLMN